MTNRLGDETSAYLLQHANNPVHWQPWDARALAAARETGKPILLSIGYSACHWCHVMAHESFEDERTAELMNKLFVNIKVDREERPDIDRIYQAAHQLFTGHAGGWPLTVFLTPEEHLPIFTGTYFPRERRYGMPSFVEVIRGISEYASAETDDVRVRGRALVDALRRRDDDSDDFGGTLDDTPIRAAGALLEQSFDSAHGGFGAAPKFPQPVVYEFLLEQWDRERRRRGGTRQLPQILHHSLSAIAQRGLHDHLGGGFFRYCVDAEWQIPHFEKMLYDNAALLALFADAYSAGGDTEYAAAAIGTADWVTREMQSEQGPYFASLDADSEGEEGKYYVWTRAELEAALDPEQRRIAASAFGTDGPPNFEGQFWHLQRRRNLAEVAQSNGLEVSRAADLLDAARAALLIERGRRVRPGLDDKSITSWNGLMIGAMARAGRRLKQPDMIAAATRAADFIRSRLWIDGRLHSNFSGGRARFAAYLDDYAFMAFGLLELLQAQWRSEDLNFARALLDTMLARFADPQGGFFFTADDHETLPYRPKSFADEAIPSGNGIAALTLQAFGHLLGEQRYLEAATTAVRASLPHLERYPHGHATMLRALAAELEPPELIVVRGPAGELNRWRGVIDRDYRAARYSFCIADSVAGLPGMLAERSAGRATRAYVCSGIVCLEPLESLDALSDRLQAATLQS